MNELLSIAKSTIRLYAKDPPADDYWSYLWPKTGGYCGIYKDPVYQRADVVWRGTDNIPEWIDNLTYSTAKDGSVGTVMYGFAEGVWRIQDKIDAAIKELVDYGYKITVSGHSRGAAQAAIYAGHLIKAGIPVKHTLLMGCPRPGYQQLADILKSANVVSVRNYQDKGDYDLITRVPFNVDLPGDFLDWLYVPCAEYTDICVPPPDNDSWGKFAWHHIELYMRGIEGLTYTA